MMRNLTDEESEIYDLDGRIQETVVKSESGEVSFEAVVMRFDEPNINGRIYPSSLIEEIRPQIEGGLPLAIASYGGLDLSAMPDIAGSVDLIAFDDNRMRCKVHVTEEFSNLVGDYRQRGTAWTPADRFLY